MLLQFSLHMRLLLLQIIRDCLLVLLNGRFEALSDRIELLKRQVGHCWASTSVLAARQDGLAGVHCTCGSALETRIGALARLGMASIAMAGGP